MCDLPARMCRACQRPAWPPSRLQIHPEWTRTQCARPLRFAKAALRSQTPIGQLPSSATNGGSRCRPTGTRQGPVLVPRHLSLAQPIRELVVVRRLVLWPKPLSHGCWICKLTDRVERPDMKRIARITSRREQVRTPTFKYRRIQLCRFCEFSNSPKMSCLQVIPRTFSFLQVVPQDVMTGQQDLIQTFNRRTCQLLEYG